MTDRVDEASRIIHASPSALYRAFEDPKALESWLPPEDPAFSGVMRMRWTFSPAPSGTAATVRCENVPEGISQEDHSLGLTSTLENLAAFVDG